VFYPEDNGREGLYVNIIAVTMDLSHVYTAPWIVRLPAAVAGVLTVWGLYLLVAELFGDGPGLLAAFLLATSFWGIIFSRIGFRAILAPLALIFTLWLLIKAFRAGADKKRTALWYALAAGIVYGLGFYTYIAYRVTPIVHPLLL
jgi:4-amino-4-deoxy-L-arabinose transferase-like glycosyltransferase